MKRAANSPQNLQSTDIITKQQTDQDRPLVWYPIRELGVEIQLPEDIADDLVYQYQVDPVTEWKDRNSTSIPGKLTKSVKLSSKTLISINSKECSFDNAPLGVLTRAEGKQTDVTYKNTHISDLAPEVVISLGSSFVFYEGPQSPCALSEDVYANSNKITRVFNSIFYPQSQGLDAQKQRENVRNL